MRKLLLLIPLFFVVGQALAQRVTVTGNVLDKSTGAPILKASVTVQETNVGVATDAAGLFRIDATVGQTLKISFLGYKVVTAVVAANNPKMVIELEPDVTALDEIVVTGYGTQRKADLTGAVSVVDVAKSKDVPTANVMQSLQGKVPGVYITTTGNPNGAANITIRGTTSLNNASPLYIIDGSPTTDGGILAALDQNSIETFQVLKDASAASIYGSRATGGVIIVTTKTGKDAVNFQVNSSVTTQSNTRRLSMLNTMDYGKVLWQAAVNDKTNPTVNAALYTYDWNGDFTNPVLNKITPATIIGGDPLMVAGDTDWQKQVFRQGLITENSITATAGSQRSSMLFGLGYLKNDGLVINSDFKRINGRLNSSTSFFSNKLRVGENFQFSKEKQTPIPNDQGGASVIALATTILPILPVYRTDGSFSGPLGAGFSDRSNPVQISDINKDDKQNSFSAFGNLFAELKPIPNLTVNSRLTLDYGENYDTNIERTFQGGSLGRAVNSFSVSQAHSMNVTFSNTANYSLKRPKSSTTMLVGMEAIANTNYSLGATRQGFALEDLSYYVINAGTGTVTNSGSQGGNQLLSYFSKVDYAWSDKYLTSLTMRYDGSSKFGTNNQFGFFPGASVGWVISKEKFFSSALPMISQLKLRAGYGEVGNQGGIGNDVRFQTFTTSYATTSYDINGVNTGTLPSGYQQTRQANPDLKWESTSEINLGVDFGILKQKITGSVEYFTRKTSDILQTFTPAAIVGEGSSKTINSAKVDNKGYEISLGFHDRKGNFTYGIDANASHSRDKVVYVLPSALSSFGGNAEKNILGRSRTSVFGYFTDGIFQNATEVTNSATKTGKAVGRIRYKDLNGDGKIDALDQDWIGNSLPGLEGGVDAQVSYKNFGLSVNSRYITGINVSDASRNTTDFLSMTTGVNKGTRLLQAWSINNTSSTIPAVSAANSNAENVSSDYNRVNGSFFKIQNAQLNYTVPSAIVQKLGLQSFRVYLLGKNFFLLKNKNFTGPDPETPGTVYPKEISYSLGIDAKF